MDREQKVLDSMQDIVTIISKLQGSVSDCLLMIKSLSDRLYHIERVIEDINNDVR